MSYEFFVPGRLPGANDMIAMAKGFGGKGIGYSKVKKKLTNDIALIIRGARVPKLERVYVRFEWHEPAPSRTARPLDPDNRAASQKYVFDAMKTAGVIPDDKLAQVAGFSHDFVVGGWVGVKVTVEPR